FRRVSKAVASTEMYQPKPPQFTTSFQQNKKGASGLSLKETRRASPAANEGALSDRLHVKPSLFDRIKLWNTDGIRDRFARVHRKLTHLVPGSRGLSVLSYFALWLILLVILVSVVLSIQNARKDKLTPADDRPVVTTQQPSSETPKTDFEIEVVVNANSLRVVSAPGSEELVGTVTRGDQVIQLTNPKDGWVMVRLQDGRTGYVPENLLLSPAESN
ncbi:MAG TPA: SH3 domain-containing protein, partial [Clostridia bacterium]|nr:SH3 domain-containing protein [Clostridia bacterium]